MTSAQEFFRTNIVGMLLVFVGHGLCLNVRPLVILVRARDEGCGVGPPLVFGVDQANIGTGVSDETSVPTQLKIAVTSLIVLILHPKH